MVPTEVGLNQTAVARIWRAFGLQAPTDEPYGRSYTRRRLRGPPLAVHERGLVMARKSNKEIAAALGLSVRTVTTHVANIFGKMGVSSRGELADRIREGAEV